MSFSFLVSLPSEVPKRIASCFSINTSNLSCSKLNCRMYAPHDRDLSLFRLLLNPQYPGRYLGYSTCSINIYVKWMNTPHLWNEGKIEKPSSRIKSTSAYQSLTSLLYNFIRIEVTLRKHERNAGNSCSLRHTICLVNVQLTSLPQYGRNQFFCY